LEEFGDFCKECGKQYPWYVYDFHHVDPSRKESRIELGYGWESIQDELRKCVLVCANCHREIHYRMSHEGEDTRNS
jgi:hypothetical protein